MAFLDRGAIRAADSPSIDAFDRWRTSEPFTILDSKLLNGKQEAFWDEELNGTGTATYNTGDASVSMGVSANNDYSIRQTFMRFNYQTGKSQEILLTGALGAPVADTVSRIGYFNSASTGTFSTDYDGIWIEADGSNVSWNIGKSGVVNSVTQSSWSLDTMDGNGPSGVNLDFDNVQIFFCDFEWLGVGRVRVGFVVDGIIIYCHEFNHANIESGVYMSSPNHSVRYEIRSTGGTKTMKQICSSVISEGGENPAGIVTGVSTGITTQDIGTTQEAVIGIRLKSDRLDATLKIDNVSVIATGNEETEVRILFNPTYADTPSWTSAGDEAAFEFAVGDGVNPVSDEGRILGAFYIGDNTNELNAKANTLIRNGISIDGTRDEIWVAVRTLSGTGSYVSAMNILQLSNG